MSLNAGAPDAGGPSLPPAHWLAWITALVLAIGTIVLLAVHVAVPPELWALTTAAITGGAALTPTNSG